MKDSLILLVSLILCGSVIYSGCDRPPDQYGVKPTSREIHLPKGKKLADISRSQMGTWLLIRPRRPNEEAETYEFFPIYTSGGSDGVLIVEVQ